MIGFKPRNDLRLIISKNHLSIQVFIKKVQLKLNNYPIYINRENRMKIYLQDKFFHPIVIGIKIE